MRLWCEKADQSPAGRQVGSHVALGTADLLLAPLCNLSHLFPLVGCLGDTCLTRPLCLSPSLSSFISSIPFLPVSPACLGDTWLRLSLSLSHSDPGTRALPDNGSAARHEHNKIWRTTCQSPCQCRHEMKRKAGERCVPDSSVQRERLKNSQWGPLRSTEGRAACSCADESQTGVFFYLPPVTSFFALYFHSLFSLFLLPA